MLIVPKRRHLLTRRSFIGGAAAALCCTPLRAGSISLLGTGGNSAAAAPTTLQLTSPNDFTAGSWGGINAGATGSNNQLAPDSTNTASGISVNAGSPGFAAYRTTLPITLVTGTHYRLTGYIKNVATPVWALPRIVDSLASPVAQAGYYVNTSTGAAGVSNPSGSGGVTDNVAATQGGIGNGYTKIDWDFHFTTACASDNFLDIMFVNSDGGTTPTSGQWFNVWGWGA